MVPSLNVCFVHWGLDFLKSYLQFANANTLGAWFSASERVARVIVRTVLPEPPCTFCREEFKVWSKYAY